MDERGYPLPVNFLGSIAHVIKRQRSSAFQIPVTDDGIRPPGKNWPQGFDGYGNMFGLYLKSVGTLFEVTNPVNGGKLNDSKFIFLAFVA
jgi:hypothetical protein